MFLQHLGVEQRKHLVLMAFQMMMADRLAKDEEKSIIAALKHELGVMGMNRKDFEAGPDLSLFYDRRSQMAVMMKLASIAYSDQEYHLNETRMLVKYGRMFGLRVEDMKALDSWGRRHQQLVADAHVLVEGDPADLV